MDKFLVQSVDLLTEDRQPLLVLDSLGPIVLGLELLLEGVNLLVERGYHEILFLVLDRLQQLQSTPKGLYLLAGTLVLLPVDIQTPHFPLEVLKLLILVPQPRIELLDLLVVSYYSLLSSEESESILQFVGDGVQLVPLVGHFADLLLVRSLHLLVSGHLQTAPPPLLVEGAL